MNTSTPSLKLLTPDEAANALSISKRKLRGLMAEGDIPHIKIGRCVRYLVDDLQRWVDDQKTGGKK